MVINRVIASIAGAVLLAVLAGWGWTGLKLYKVRLELANWKGEANVAQQALEKCETVRELEVGGLLIQIEASNRRTAQQAAELERVRARRQEAQEAAAEANADRQAMIERIRATAPAQTCEEAARRVSTWVESRRS